MQDALVRLRTAIVRGSAWSINLLLVDLNSVRSTAIALHRSLRRSPEFENLPVIYLKGTEPPPEELNEGARVLMLSRNMGSAELRTAISTFVSTPTTSGGTVIPPETFAEDPALAEQNPGAGKLRGRALLVEDNPINQKVAQSLIRMLGLECDTADNGEIAVQRMKAGDLDLVLMDCQMPVMDGYTATREWRQYESANSLAPLPIIAMTANAMAGDRQKCLDSGMDDYLSKPVDRRLLETCLGLWLQRSPQAAKPGAEPAAKPSPMAPLAAAFKAAGFPAGTMAPAPPPAEAIPVLEMEVIEELRSIMGAEYQGLVKLFLEDAPLHIERLQAAADAKDIPGMVAPAHTLKSSSANLGALALSAVAKRIEHSARAESLAKPSVAVLMLANEFRRAKAALLALDGS
jgi:CheY-like chemotaxis protein